MAKSSSDLDLIRQRRQQIDAERKNLAAQIDSLRRKETMLDQELHELTVTERTIARLHNIELPELIAPPEKATGGKPAGIPTVLEMANAVIASEAEGRDQLFMEGNDITEAIRRRWWPTVKPSDVTPTLWRAAKEGRIYKNGTRYARVKPDDRRSPAEIAGVNDTANE